MQIKNILFIFLFILALSFFIKNCIRLINYLSVGQKENRTGNYNERIKNVFKIALVQTKLFREPLSGSLHFLIFWGFVLFLFAIAESVCQGFYSPFNLSFLGAFYSAITIIEDVFGVLVIFAVLYSLFRRFIVKVPRLNVDKAGRIDAAVILVWILFVVLAMFGQNSAHIAKQNFVLSEYEIRPVSFWLSSVFYGSCSNCSSVMYETFWWMHVVFVLGFLNYLPYSKHLHILASIPNVFLSKLAEEKNVLKPLDLADENAETYGVADIEQLTWKQLLDGYSCTECGRCTSVCPAATVGKQLSPRDIIVSVRKRTFEKAPDILKNSEKVSNGSLIHDFISDNSLWQCTTCNACVEECPVTIEHVETIVDLRRNLVLTESQFPAQLNSVFKNLETNYNPWPFSQAERADWAEGLGIKTLAENPDCDILFWVGCAGSFDARYKKVSQSFAKLMQKADISFGILGVEEKCNGDTARRLGNEYLAQTLVQQNIETLNKYNVKKIVTACPHCYNSLKNEFKQFGGNYEVLHHTEMIEKLIEEKKIELKEKNDKAIVTYHDSCYLGRYNNVYDAPRESISKIPGIELVEMKRNKSRGFCCGAGGGRMFLEDEEGGRINEERTKEAVETNANMIASACPFCMTMLNDGVKKFNKQEEIEIKDIAEIVLENSK
jgi:Fe-S oxidoreductase